MTHHKQKLRKSCRDIHRLHNWSSRVDRFCAESIVLLKSCKDGRIHDAIRNQKINRDKRYYAYVK